MTIWLSFLCVMTWVYLRDGGFGQFSQPIEAGVVLLFWIFGFAGGNYLFSLPLVNALISHSDIILRRRWVWRTQEERFRPCDVPAPFIRNDRDNDGDSLFRLVLTTPSGHDVVLSESGDRARIEALLSQILTHFRD